MSIPATLPRRPATRANKRSPALERQEVFLCSHLPPRAWLPSPRVIAFCAQISAGQRQSGQRGQHTFEAVQCTWAREAEEPALRPKAGAPPLAPTWRGFTRTPQAYYRCEAESPALPLAPAGHLPGHRSNRIPIKHTRWWLAPPC